VRRYLYGAAKVAGKRPHGIDTPGTQPAPGSAVHALSLAFRLLPNEPDPLHER